VNESKLVGEANRRREGLLVSRRARIRKGGVLEHSSAADAVKRDPPPQAKRPAGTMRASDGDEGATDGDEGATDGDEGAADGDAGATDGNAGATDGGAPSMRSQSVQALRPTPRPPSAAWTRPLRAVRRAITAPRAQGRHGRGLCHVPRGPLWPAVSCTATLAPRERNLAVVHEAK
jgi:hypothetical protein